MFLSSILCIIVNVQEKRRLVQDFEKIPAVEQTGIKQLSEFQNKLKNSCLF